MNALYVLKYNNGTSLMITIRQWHLSIQFNIWNEIEELKLNYNYVWK